MKINRTRSIAKTRMFRANKTKNRPEALLACDLIEAHLPRWAYVVSEKTLEVVHPDTNKKVKITPDIIVKLQQKKWAIEVNGLYHDERKPKRIDRMRRLILESHGWQVLTISQNYAPILFKRHRRKLDVDECLTAFREITLAIGAKLPLPVEGDRKLVELVLRKT